jgi:hypothetical protein
MESLNLNEESRELRERGNNEYRRSRAVGLSPCVEAQRLEQALLYYARALKTAAWTDDRVRLKT